MKKVLITLFLSFAVYSYAQVDLYQKFRELYDAKKYSEIINYKPGKNEELTAAALFYIAMSYYDTSQNDNAFKYFNLILKKYPDNRGWYCLTHLTMGEIYLKNGEFEKSLKSYKAGLAKLERSDETYLYAAYNVGTISYLLNKHAESKGAFEKVLEIDPDDYQTIAKLVQTHYALGEYDRAKPYKDKLYAAYEEKKLPKQMQDMFCFDQFMWNKKKVMVFEMFDEDAAGNVFLSIKLCFYILRDDGEIDYRVNMESSVATRMNESGKKYVLCKVKDNSYFTYWQKRFDDNYNYKEVKSAVIDILEGKVQPGSSTTPITTPIKK